MTRKRLTPRTPSRSRLDAPSSSVNVRMYNVGFGDCFLVTIGNGDRPLRILFDCGSIAADPAVTARWGTWSVEFHLPRYPIPVIENPLRASPFVNRARPLTLR